MACLTVPFSGNSIKELYKKITKGAYAKIPTRYTPELTEIIQLCLIKDQIRRPTVEELLEHPIILKKIDLYNIKLSIRNVEDFGLLGGDLMGTIKLPRNLDNLIQRLPKKRYSSQRNISIENSKHKPQNFEKKRE